MKFEKVSQPDKSMIALKEKGRIWYVATQQVYDSAKQYLKENDEVEIKLADYEKEGLKVINFIKKIGSDNTPAPEKEKTGYKCTECGYALKDAKYTKCYNCNQKTKENKPTSSDKPTCEDCGAELKDKKYTKCYTCNQKKPARTESASSKSKYYSKSPEESEKIKRLSIFSSVCSAVSSLTGQVDLNTLGNVIETLYDKFYEKISK